jgi:hypothetical protein
MTSTSLTRSAACAVHEVAQFDHEQPAIDDLGDDQAEVQGSLDPAAPENEVLHRLDDLVHGSRRWWCGAAILPQEEAGLPAAA